MISPVRTTLALAAAFAVTGPLPAMSSAFTAGTITAIAPDDALNIRKWPSSNSKIIDAYQLGETISLTGRCKNIVTNVSFRIDGYGSAKWRYAQMKKTSVWCQVMTNNAETGWARGKYIWPN